MPIDGVIYSYIVSHQTYQDKAVIIEENAKGDWIYVVLKGQVKVKKRPPRDWSPYIPLRKAKFSGKLLCLERERGLGRLQSLLMALLR